MKLSKTEFKTLMKECLTELINEGAFDKKLGSIAESKMKYGTSYSHVNQNASQNSPSVMSENVQVNNRLQEIVRTVTGAQPGERRNLYTEILMDTAQTTLQKQISAESGTAGLGITAPVSAQAKAQDEAELSALAGGNMNRWAAAAFAGKKKP